MFHNTELRPFFQQKTGLRPVFLFCRCFRFLLLDGPDALGACLNTQTLHDGQLLKIRVPSCSNGRIVVAAELFAGAMHHGTLAANFTLSHSFRIVHYHFPLVNPHTNYRSFGPKPSLYIPLLLDFPESSFCKDIFNAASQSMIGVGGNPPCSAKKSQIWDSLADTGA